MTHDELLEIVKNNPTTRAVVELHKPIEDKWMESEFRCAGCENRCGCYEGDMNGDNDWSTCPTIQVIEKQLA